MRLRNPSRNYFLHKCFQIHFFPTPLPHRKRTVSLGKHSFGKAWNQNFVFSKKVAEKLITPKGKSQMEKKKINKPNPKLPSTGKSFTII